MKPYGWKTTCSKNNLGVMRGIISILGVVRNILEGDATFLEEMTQST